MPDILIRGMEMPKSCEDCHDADLPTSIAWLEAKCPCAYGMNKPGVYDLRHKRHPDCPLVELPQHGDLIDVSKIVLEYGGLAKISPHDFVGIAKYFAEQIEGQTVVVPTEMVSKAHEEFIKEANKNRAIKHEQEVKNFRDFAISLRDEAREIKNGNVPFPERSDK